MNRASMRRLILAANRLSMNPTRRAGLDRGSCSAPSPSERSMPTEFGRMEAHELCVGGLLADQISKPLFTLFAVDLTTIAA